jgi:hypothetical protein
MVRDPITEGTKLHLTNCTITGNSTNSTSDSGTGGGGISIEVGTVMMTNTLVAGNSSAADVPDLAGDFTSGGHNVVGSVSGSTGITNGVNGDQAGNNSNLLDALTGSLGNYGGDTETVPLLYGSPAIDSGDDAACPATDQRGVPRPVGSACDVGAFEARLGTFLPLLFR